MEQKKRKRRWGDRADGRKIRSLSPMTRVAFYIMPRRNGANNLLRDSFDLEPVEEYIMKKRSEGYKYFGVMHVIVAAYIRILSQYPGINRFLSGQKLYARNDIEVMLTAKKEMKLESSDTCLKFYFAPDAVASDVYEQITSEIEKCRKEDSDFDDTAKILSYIPGVLLKFAVGFLRFLDYFGLLPRFLTKISPFHGSMFITSMASLGIPVIYHHLYDFGNVPVFVAFSAKYAKNVIKDDGTVEKRKYIDYSFVCDERICDGYYYAMAFKYFKRILANPEVLDTPPEEIKEDID